MFAMHYCSSVSLSQEQPQPYRTMIEVIVHSLSSKTSTSTSRSHDPPSMSPSPQMHSHTVTNTTPPRGNPIAYTNTTSSDPNITQQLPSSHSNPLFSSPPVSHFQQRTSSASSPSTATTGRGAEQYLSSRPAINPRDRRALKTNTVSSNVRGGVMQAEHKTAGKKFKPRSLAELNSAIHEPETTSVPNETPAVSSRVSGHSTLEGEPRTTTLFGDVASGVDQTPAVLCVSPAAKKVNTIACD